MKTSQKELEWKRGGLVAWLLMLLMGLSLLGEVMKFTVLGVRAGFFAVPAMLGLWLFMTAKSKQRGRCEVYEKSGIGEGDIILEEADAQEYCGSDKNFSEDNYSAHGFLALTKDALVFGENPYRYIRRHRKPKSSLSKTNAEDLIKAEKQRSSFLVKWLSNSGRERLVVHTREGAKYYLVKSADRWVEEITALR